ncbi:MAG: hypothetical protein WAT18_01975 [Sphingorhabdus sp.]
MRLNNAMDGQIRALAIALAGAAATAVAAMFVPTAIYETITGSTGISEVFPSTKAPLGDTARALIAFATAALAFALLSAFLLRQNASPVVRAAAPAAPVSPAAPIVQLDREDNVIADAKPSALVALKKKLSDFVESRRKGSDGIKDLADLPKLRAEDAHPDAPPRRPISAHRDFGEPAVAAKAEVFEAPMPEASSVMVEAAVESSAAVEPEQTVVPAPAAIAENPAEGQFVSVVERLEQAVAQRQQKLDELDRVAREIVSSDAPLAIDPAPSITADVTAADTPIRPQPYLSAIDGAKPGSSSAKSNDDMDAALRSALETLHKMNARSR